jgi:hypothetical protein
VGLAKLLGVSVPGGRCPVSLETGGLVLVDGAQPPPTRMASAITMPRPTTLSGISGPLRLSQRVQPCALPAQALRTVLGEPLHPAKIESGSRCASAITSASVPPVGHTLPWST